ncbi:hypothetical protein MesoLjLb_28820 [Mesorhizobium sp. L-8-3]|nr:hypothetical protein MesoLjLb_28820 [Mesorhizobium sp. L-8-3]
MRGRGLAVYLTVFNGAMAGGSLGWGLVAQQLGVPTTLIVAGVGLALAAFGLHLVKLPAGEDDLMPSRHWPEPLTAEPVDNDRGPVLIQVEYRIEKKDRPGFLDAMRHLAGERRRDGAFNWGITEDAADPERIIEWFMMESWAEHMRQHKRVSKADADLQKAVLAFHRGPAEPRVSHHLALQTKRAGQ